MKDWQKKETEDAKSFNGRKTPKSGGYFSFPGDVITEDFLIDSKLTKNKSFSITAKMWKKIYNEALKSRRLPCLSVSLSNYNIELIILDKNDFLSFLKGRNE